MNYRMEYINRIENTRLYEAPGTFTSQACGLLSDGSHIVLARATDSRIERREPLLSWKKDRTYLKLNGEFRSRLLSNFLPFVRVP